MRILHVMLSKGKGGLEQAFQNYNQALLELSHTVHCVVDISYPLPRSERLQFSSISNLGPWDIAASWRLRKIAAAFAPDIIIAHANRAIQLLSRFTVTVPPFEKGGLGGISTIKTIPLVGVLHNATAKRALSCDALITVARHIQKSLEARGLAKCPIYVLPNMVVAPLGHPLPSPPPSRGVDKQITIGVLARLDTVKGIDLFLESLALLKKNLDFRAIIAGDGPERKTLENQANVLGLTQTVRFIGWVQDKKAFFDKIDIFCLPSRREGLPVALLEAFAYQKPVVATSTEGAKEVCSHGEDAYLAGFEPAEMASYLGSLIQEPQIREKFIKNAFFKVQQQYSQPIFTQNFGKILNAISDSLVPPFKKGGLGGILSRFIKKHFYINRWNIGLLRAPITECLAHNIHQQGVHWLSIPKRHQFMADPFVVAEQGQIFLFYEFLDYRNKIGKIHFAKLDPLDFSVQETGEALSSSKHLSYPYVFKEGDHFYMIPESSAAGEISLYVAEQFPRQWKKAHTLFHLGGVDNTILFYENQWWLFFTLSRYPGQALQELHLAFCDSLMGQWQLHSKNPVKIDRASARPAGTPFIHEGSLFRPAQDCSNGYGGGIVLNKITKLSKNEFCEEKLRVIQPLAEFPDGLHTLSACDSALTVIDGLRMEFTPFKFVTTWKRRWFRFRRWLGR